MNIPGFRDLRVRTVLGESVAEFLRDDAPTYAAALAYHLLLALFPFLIFLLALLGLIESRELFDEILRWAGQTLPSEAMQQVRSILTEVQQQSSGGLLSFGILVSIWVASLGMRSVMNALNRAYDIEEGRPRLKRYSLSILYTLVFAALVVVASALMVLGPQLAARLAGWVGLSDVFVGLWRWIRIPIALLLAMLATSLVYYFAPNLEQRFRLVTPGSVVAVLLWAAVSAAFQYYVTHFGRYSVTYGSIGAVIILLLYFFLSGSILLFGGELNAVIQKRAPRRDDPKPGE